MKAIRDEPMTFGSLLLLFILLFGIFIVVYKISTVNYAKQQDFSNCIIAEWKASVKDTTINPNTAIEYCSNEYGVKVID